MRIGVNANYFRKPSTGIGVVTLEFMRAIAKTAEGSAHEWIWYYEGEIPAGSWPEHWQFKPVSTWWTRDDVPHRYLWERFALPRAVQADKCDVFFSLYQSATRVPKHIRHVMLVHDLVPMRFPEYLRNFRLRFHYRAINRAIRSADYILTPSQATKNDIGLFLAIPEIRITVAPLGVTAAFREPLTSEARDSVLTRYGLRAGYLYHGGGLERRKNTALLLRAYAALVESANQNELPPLVISGTIHAEDNPLATPVRTLITELGLAERVRLLGWVPDDDLPALYQGALAFVYPSRYEGFGLPVLEAFASGTPVITTAAGSLAELAQDAASIILVDDVESLTQAIHLLVSDTALHSVLAAKGKARSAAYVWPRFASSVTGALLQ
jgi:alpha-1,3-rhamnosyl/mannosyltransferase